jgi:hypothetical protein
LTTPVHSPAPQAFLDASPPGLARSSRARLITVIAAVLVFIVGFSIVIGSIAGRPSRVAFPVASAAPSSRSSHAVSSPVPPPASAAAPAAAPAPTPTPTPAPAPPSPAAEERPPSAPARPAKPSTEATLVVACTPECQSVTVDGNAIEAFPASLEPGAHVVVVKRGLHTPQTKYVKLGAGRETKVSFIWWKTPPGPPGAAGKKPCGKFLQRCN